MRREASSDVGLQTLQAVHALHVALDGGLARDWLGTLGQEPPSLSVAQSLALVPTWERERDRETEMREAIENVAGAQFESLLWVCYVCSDARRNV